MWDAGLSPKVSGRLQERRIVLFFYNIKSRINCIYLTWLCPYVTIEDIE